MDPWLIIPIIIAAFAAGAIFNNIWDEMQRSRAHKEDKMWRMGCEVESLKLKVAELQMEIQSHLSDPDTGGT